MNNLKKGDWVFDSKVAEDFLNIAQTNIPDYNRVIGLVIKIAKKYLNNDSKILDFWSALWFTLENLYNNWFRNLYWVDSSIDMISRSFKWANLVNLDKFPLNLWKFDFIISNWTLHFIKDRELYIKDMYDSLNEWGYLFITEKILTSNMSEDLYHDFKRSMWLTDEEILKKKLSIEWVLIPKSLEWYLNIFNKTWFKNIDIVNATPSFYSFLLKK